MIGKELIRAGSESGLTPAKSNRKFNEAQRKCAERRLAGDTTTVIQQRIAELTNVAVDNFENLKVVAYEIKIFD